jgi:predicted Zn-dependent peptidase
MPLLIESMPGVRSVGVTLLLPAGSATDPDNRQGLCTMWSELVFRGAGLLDSRAQADAMDRLGMSRACDPSTFHLRMGFTLLGDRLIDALPTVVDMVRRPRMEEAAIGPTRDLAIQAIESLADDPQQRAVLALKERHAPPPINRSGMGTIESLEATTRDDLVNGWERQARPAGSILAIAGDVGGDAGIARLVSQLDTLLAGWSGAAPAVRIGTSLSRGTYHHIEDKSSQVQIVLIHDAPAEPQHESRLERVVASVLSGGMAARLFTEVREKRGLCYSVSESYSAERDYGRCVAYVGTTPERAQESLDVLMAELHRVNSPAGRITQEEFDRAMIGIKSGLIFSGESTGARAGALAGDQYRLGRPRSLDEVAAMYAAITLDEVNAYLARRKLGDVTIVTLGQSALKPPA